jgi:hypothetical protein
MLSGHPRATVKNTAVGATFHSTRYEATILGADYTLWDTAGLNEGRAGSVPADEALKRLKELVQELRDAGGLSLLVYCVFGSRLGDITKVNYDLFVRIICQAQVPVVMVITGLENEPVMEDWWTANNQEFARYGIEVEDHACVTTTKGNDEVYEDLYDESTIAVQHLIQNRCPNTAWAATSERWFDRVSSQIREYYDDRAGKSQGKAAGFFSRYWPKTSSESQGPILTS